MQFYTNSLKICDGGIYATAYYQPDDTINVYVSFGNYVEKYKLTKADPNTIYFTLSSFVCKIEDCSCVYELFNNNILKKTNTGWVFDTLEF